MSLTKTSIIIGDSFNNTLGLIRSLGKADVRVVLILVGSDRLHICKSKYVSEALTIQSLNECAPLLKNLAIKHKGAFLICSNDKAAKWVDDNESWLSELYVTPMRGRNLGDLFDKPKQCELADQFGICVPKSSIFSRGTEPDSNLEYPLLLKPANSNTGEKSDIHICQNRKELDQALMCESNCRDFIVQEYIDKDYEINLIGVCTDRDVIIPGGIKKLRHYPTIWSPCSFGIFLSTDELKIDVLPIVRLMKHIGYRGPFSVEFLRKNDKTYFLEINFRHDGLAYTATAAGANLLKMYADNKMCDFTVRPTFMMDLSTDFCHVKVGNISRRKWLTDFWKTRCQLNFNRRDPMPTVFYYLKKFFK